MTPFQVPLARQEFWEMAKGPVMVTLLTDTPAEPVLVICTSCAALVAPVVSEPNERLGAAEETEEIQAPSELVSGPVLAQPTTMKLRVPAAVPATVVVMKW